MNLAESMQANSWLYWGLSITFGFPLVMVLLSEILHRLNSQGRPLYVPIRHLRNITLPLLAFLVFLEKIVGLPASDTVVKLVYTLVFISVLIALLTFANVMLFAEASATSWRARVPKLFLDLSRAFFVFVGLGLVLGMVWEADLKAFFTALGIGSVVIGLALQDTLGNLFSGIALLFEKPFAIGDVIRVGEREGIVKEMTWRATWIHVTSNNSLLIIPNLALTKEQVVNLSRQGKYLVCISLDFSLGDPPNRVKRALLETAASLPGILSEHEVEVTSNAYTNSAIQYEVSFAVSNYAQRCNAKNEFITRIWYAAQRHKLTIPFPTNTVYQYDMGEKASTGTVMERLAGIATLQAMPAAEMKELSDACELQYFGRNELFIREGESGTTLYLIIEGEALLSAKDNKGIEREVARLGQGEYIGLLQVMLGQTSPFSARALTDVLLVAIPAEAANRMTDRSPRLARDLGQSIEARRHAILRAQEGHAGKVQI